MRDLYRRLNEKGFSSSFVRSFVLPEWWQDEMADVEANRVLAETYIAKQLGLSARELRDESHELSFPAMARLRFKRYKNHVDEKVRVSAVVAQRAAKAVARSVSASAPEFSGRREAAEVRNSILRDSEFVDLTSLLEFCWKSGIVVIPLARTPSGSKRFDGMATFANDRPVIVLASRRDGPPWLAFYLAHELGHIMLGHVGPNTGAVVDGTLASETGSSRHEREADRFACELLTGFPEPRIKDLKAKAPELAVIAAGSAPERGIDPGVFTLIYAKSNCRWPVAQNALNLLGSDKGGRALVEIYLDRYLDLADLSEVDERFLSVLKAA